MRVLVLGIDTWRSQEVALLQETGGRGRVLPIWIGREEALAMDRARRNTCSTRVCEPDTHQLIGKVISAAGDRLQRTEITALHEHILYADLVLDDGLRVSARPSDAIIIALQHRVPIEVSVAVLERAGVPATAIVIEGDPSGADRLEDGLLRPAGTGAGTEISPERGAVATQQEWGTRIAGFRRFLETAIAADFEPERMCDRGDSAAIRPQGPSAAPPPRGRLSRLRGWFRTRRGGK